MQKPELLAPAGNYEKLKTAIHFGADAVYLGGKNFSLRSFADNFTEEELKKGVEYAHAHGVKVYVTVNIFAKDGDFPAAAEYFRFLEKIGADAVLITDPGLFTLCGEVAPRLTRHISTQSNTLNGRTAKFWKELGASRVVLARELSVSGIKEIHEIAPDVELEVFVHGAMCISYSGRCLLSNYLTGRDANRGECVQACRFSYALTEAESGKVLPVEEDGRGSYILNSKDLNLIRYLPALVEAGAVSFKIEGRMKSEYYLATVVSAYRKAIDFFFSGGKELPDSIAEELEKVSHREYTTAYALGENDGTVASEVGGTHGGCTFICRVTGEKDGYTEVEMRNRFYLGDRLEILSANGEADGKSFVVSEILDENGEKVTDAKRVQQKLYLKVPYALSEDDILRK